MEHDAALDQLKALVAGEPPLTDAQLDLCLERAQIPDTDPQQYDVNAALAEAWELKAAITAEGYSVSLDGQTLSRQQHFEHCKDMAHMYRSRALISTARFGRSDVTTR